MNDFHTTIEQAADPFASCSTDAERQKVAQRIANARLKEATLQALHEVKAQYPVETAKLHLHGYVVTRREQPAELNDHLATIIGRILTEPGADKITNTAWTADLNRAFGNRLNPATFSLSGSWAKFYGAS